MHVLRICSSQLWQSEHDGLRSVGGRQPVLLVLDFQSFFAFSKERMHCDAGFHIFYLSGEHVINLHMATCPIHLQSCMGRAIRPFIVRKCYPFVLMGKEWKTCRPCEEIQLKPCYLVNWTGKVLPVSFWTVTGIGYPFPLLYPPLPQYSTDRGNISAWAVS